MQEIVYKLHTVIAATSGANHYQKVIKVATLCSLHTPCYAIDNIHIFVYIYVWGSIYVPLCICPPLYMSLFVYVCVCVCAFVYICVYVRMCACVYNCVCVCVCVCVHAHMHVHMLSVSVSMASVIFISFSFNKKFYMSLSSTFSNLLEVCTVKGVFFNYSTIWAFIIGTMQCNVQIIFI